MREAARYYPPWPSLANFAWEKYWSAPSLSELTKDSSAIKSALAFRYVSVHPQRRLGNCFLSQFFRGSCASRFLQYSQHLHLFVRTRSLIPQHGLKDITTFPDDWDADRRQRGFDNCPCQRYDTRYEVQNYKRRHRIWIRSGVLLETDIGAIKPIFDNVMQNPQFVSAHLNSQSILLAKLPKFESFHNHWKRYACFFGPSTKNSARYEKSLTFRSLARHFLYEYVGSDLMFLFSRLIG
ncbi:hypothetical protein [Ruegeria lacuscaerulensis]|uniref:hypothetical protein n=1 Tax=Ruegeria lacuscaerulensis TaxID=55218 RepID=UPI00147C5CF6|nr:hypothetical protein [Ruegeria lacuscaerulensis]